MKKSSIIIAQSALALPFGLEAEAATSKAGKGIDLALRTLAKENVHTAPGEIPYGNRRG